MPATRTRAALLNMQQYSLRGDHVVLHSVARTASFARILHEGTTIHTPAFMVNQITCFWHLIANAKALTAFSFVDHVLQAKTMWSISKLYMTLLESNVIICISLVLTLGLPLFDELLNSLKKNCESNEYNDHIDFYITQ